MPTRSALIQQISSLLRKGEQSREKSDQYYAEAGRKLCELKERHDAEDGTWAQWEKLLKVKFGISRSRASELMQIGSGKKTGDEVRNKRAARQAGTRARRKAERNQSSPPRGGENQPSNDNEPEETFDDDDAESALLVCAIRVGQAWEAGKEAMDVLLPRIIAETKPCHDDWNDLIARVRATANTWNEFAEKLEAQAAPETRRTKRILAAA